jgi:hypothetical protein
LRRNVEHFAIDGDANRRFGCQPYGARAPWHRTPPINSSSQTTLRLKDSHQPGDPSKMGQLRVANVPMRVEARSLPARACARPSKCLLGRSHTSGNGVNLLLGGQHLGVPHLNSQPGVLDREPL